MELPMTQSNKNALRLWIDFIGFVIVSAKDNSMYIGEKVE
jgi:hypothetical protein